MKEFEKKKRSIWFFERQSYRGTVFHPLVHTLSAVRAGSRGRQELHSDLPRVAGNQTLGLFPDALPGSCIRVEQLGLKLVPLWMPVL